MTRMAWLAIAVALVAAGCATPTREELRAQGERQIEMGQSDEAIRTFDRMHSLYPQDPAALYYLARAYHSKGDHGMAIVYYRAALDAAPWMTAAREGLVRAQRQSSIQTEETLRFVPSAP